jgi:hypothetical protein
MIFSIDNVVHYIYNPAVKNASTWPFNAPQYLLLNVAIEPIISPSFIQSAMEIDYVRVYQESPLSIEETPTSNNIIVHPNPVNDFLKVQLNENSIGARAKLYSILGQELNTFDLNSNENTLDISHLSQGTYFIRIESNTEIKTVTLIKQ